MKSVWYTVKTEYGKFQLKIVVTLDRNTNQPKSFTINIGSKTKQCVQLQVPARETNKTDALLIWVEADEECSLERYIQKGLAQHMVLLGITLVRQINPKIKTISFDDTSSFKCALPDDTEIRVPMKAFHIAFHGSTWYEYYFDAMLKQDHAKYCDSKKNLYDPHYKPDEFNFINGELQEELEPLYNASSTWYEFFQRISKKYDNKKCSVIYPWISSAITSILNGNLYDHPKWYIDLEANQKKNKTPSIRYNMSAMNKMEGGRTNYTLKKRKARRFTSSRTHLFPNIPQIQGWDFKAFLS